MTLVGNDHAWIRYKFFPEFDELASWNKNAKDVVTFDFHISNIEMIEIIIIAIIVDISNTFQPMCWYLELRLFITNCLKI